MWFIAGREKSSGWHLLLVSVERGTKMRLLDQVMQCRSNVEVDLPGTGKFELPGAGARAAALAESPLRYVLGDNIRHQCEHIWRTWPELLSPSNARLRIPTERLWMEWEVPTSVIALDARKQRCGILINSDDMGRSGTIESFWEDATYGVDRAQVTIEFDLDHPISSKPGHHARFPIKAAQEFPFARHVAASLEPGWRDYFSFTRMPRHGLSDVVDLCLERIWTDVPMMLAFILLIGARPEIQERRVERAKLNAARKKRGKLPLLDHVEMSLMVGNGGLLAPSQRGLRGRQAPRLHLVRGHLVQRGGTLFWRQAHLRGRHDLPPITSKTVTVTISDNWSSDHLATN